MSKELFDKNKYAIVKNVISKELAQFSCDYLSLKKQCLATLIKTNNLVPHIHNLGILTGDPQVPGAYATYADYAMEIILQNLKPNVEKITGYKLYSSYSYARIYEKGNELVRHIDRMSCEISTTLNLGGDPWPIFLEPSGKKGKKGVKVDLSPGDMLVYKGCDIEHWREKFKGNICYQVFFHYRDVNFSKDMPDGKPHLGLPRGYNYSEYKE
jgi:hypothetical protein